MKIVLHGFGTFSIIFRHMIDAAKRLQIDVEWAIVLNTSHHKALFTGLLPDDHILVLEEKRSLNPSSTDSSQTVANFKGNIFEAIEAEKRITRHLPAELQLARAADMYSLYKAFLERVKPTHLLVSQVEGLDGKILIASARELGLHISVPTSYRNLGGLFFSPDEYETLPHYRKADAHTLRLAEEIVTVFQASGKVPEAAALPPQKQERLPSFHPSLHRRIVGFIKRTVSRPDLFEFDYLRASLLNNLPLIRDWIWGIRAAINRRIFDVSHMADLPKRYIYYPLQVTPESSINTPAPFFVDQMRAIDAIRFAMPNDCLLVVKEHPSCIGVRPVRFMKAIRRKAGVCIASYRLDTLDLIRRASATITVTGTAAQEAFLLGCPSLVLGPCYIAPYLGGVSQVGELRNRLATVLDTPLDNSRVIAGIAEILSVRFDATFRAPDDGGEAVLDPANIERLLTGYLSHVQRDTKV